MEYSGGRVLASPRVVVVLWGDKVRSTLPPEVVTFYERVPSLGQWDWLSQYDTPNQQIGRGTFQGVLEITPSTTKTTLAGRDIAREVAAQIGAGKLPDPGLDSTYYAVYLPDEITVQDPDEEPLCRFAIAYHDVLTHYGFRGTFGVFPSCARDTISAFHELFEAATDPYFSGWLSPEGEEIGDLCEVFETTLPLPDGGFLALQQLWSNRLNRCAASSDEFWVSVSPSAPIAGPVVSVALTADGPGVAPEQVSWSVYYPRDAEFEVTRDPADAGWTLTLHLTPPYPGGIGVVAQAGGWSATAAALLSPALVLPPDGGTGLKPPTAVSTPMSGQGGGCSQAGEGSLPLAVLSLLFTATLARGRAGRGYGAAPSFDSSSRNASRGMLLRSSPP